MSEQKFSVGDYVSCEGFFGRVVGLLLDGRYLVDADLRVTIVLPSDWRVPVFAAAIHEVALWRFWRGLISREELDAAQLTCDCEGCSYDGD